MTNTITTKFSARCNKKKKELEVKRRIYRVLCSHSFGLDHRLLTKAFSWGPALWFLGVYSNPVLFLGRMSIGGSWWRIGVLRCPKHEHACSVFLLASCYLGDPWQLSHCVSYPCLVVASVRLGYERILCFSWTRRNCFYIGWYCQFTSLKYLVRY